MNGNLHGRGYFTWPDGRKYEGQFVDDKKQGYGVYIWPDGKSKLGYLINFYFC